MMIHSRRTNLYFSLQALLKVFHSHLYARQGSSKMESPSTSSKRGFPSDWIIWQMLDSGLPTGGFAHSFGLEAAVQLGQYGLQVRE